MKPSDEELEQFRRSGIRLDAEGHFQHEGQPFRHAGFIAAMWRWLDRNPDGRYVLRLDERRFVYLDVEDAPYVVRSLRIENERAILHLSDGSEEALRPETLRIAGTGIAYCTVKNTRSDMGFDARLAPPALAALAERIDEEAGTARLRLGGSSFVLGPVTP